MKLFLLLILIGTSMGIVSALTIFTIETLKEKFPRVKEFLKP